MPKMSGIDFLRKIRKDDSLKNLRVVVVSASGGSNEIKQSFEKIKKVISGKTYP